MVYSVTLWRQKNQTSPFLDFGILTVGGILKKLNSENGCRTTKTASKSFLFSNAFMAKSCTQTLMFKSVTTHRETDKQKKLYDFWPLQQRVKSGPNKLGMVLKTQRKPIP